MSRARRQPTRNWSILCGLPCRIDASSIAASRLFAAPIAWMSPVKWRLRSSIGTTCVMPPPAAPPLMPKTGPSDGSRRHATGRLPTTPSPCVRPTSVVVLPSPAICSTGLRTASCAISRLLFISLLLVTHRSGRQLGHELVGVEALDRKGGDQVGGPARVDQLGQRLADDRCGLEAVGAPAGADVEVLDLGLA